VKNDDKTKLKKENRALRVYLRNKKYLVDQEKKLLVEALAAMRETRLGLRVELKNLNPNSKKNKSLNQT
jgi:hypothetical protein